MAHQVYVGLHTKLTNSTIVSRIVYILNNTVKLLI